ncbi:hypothetical protein HRbin39_00121 [bacterium HR39]|nr:hypothetical protein HRbin39_00121 [bacterium HR39]
MFQVEPEIVRMERKDPLEGAKAALRAAVLRATEGDGEALRPLARALGAHYHLSPGNRLLVAAQAGRARRAWNSTRWAEMGHVVHPEAEGVLVNAPRGDGGFTVKALYTEAEVEPRPREEDLKLDTALLLPALKGFLKEGDPEDPEEAFLRAGTRYLVRGLGHGSPKLWEELRVAEAWMAATALQGLLGREADLPLEERVLLGAYGKRPALLGESLKRVGGAVSVLAQALGLVPKRRG